MRTERALLSTDSGSELIIAQRAITLGAAGGWRAGQRTVQAIDPSETNR